MPQDWSGYELDLCATGMCHLTRPCAYHALYEIWKIGKSVITARIMFLPFPRRWYLTGLASFSPHAFPAEPGDKAETKSNYAADDG